MVYFASSKRPLPPPTAAATDGEQAPANVIRFFSVAQRLPMEVQMILCNRVAGSMRQNISSKDSEPAFQSLAERLLLLDEPTSSSSEISQPQGQRFFLFYLLFIFCLFVCFCFCFVSVGEMNLLDATTNRD